MAISDLGVPRRRAGLLAATIGCLATPVSAQTVRGLVLEADTDRPVPLATVSLMSASGNRLASVLTTEEGFFVLQADDDGTYFVRAVALGYRVGRAGPFQLDEDGLLVVEVRLSAQPLDLEGLLVEGTATTAVGNNLTRNGFWERLAEGRGQFLTPGAVARSEAMFTPHLLRGLNHVIPQYGAPPWTTWVSFHRATFEFGPCAPRVFVDGVWMNRPGFGIAADAGLDEVIPMELVEAVEVYWGPFQAPLKYQGTTDCGVVLIWSKHGR